MPTYMTAAELAKALRVSPETVKQMARDGRIPSIRLSPKVIRFDVQAVADAMTRLAAGKQGVADA